MTNPFISACKLKKYHAIIKILNIAKDNPKQSDSLSRLLLENYDKISGDNCLITLYKNGYYKYIIDILNFLDKNGENGLLVKLLSYQNPYNDESLMIQICKNEINEEIIGEILDCIEDNRIAEKLLKQQRDIRRNCAMDYAKPVVVNKINQYFGK